MSKRLLCAGAGLVLALAAPTTLSAQSYAVQVWDQLQLHYKTISKNDNDWYLRNYVMGKLRDDGDDTWTFYFDKNQAVIITAACDNDCSDIDLKVTDENGTVLAEDDKKDDTPVLAFRPSAEGRLTIKVHMEACSDNPCYFGFGIFQK
jgi:hypothetical protein